LPRVADLTGQDQIGPQVDEQRTVDRTVDVRGHALAEGDLPAAGSLTPVAEAEDPTRV
jgi:hypothetical protein